MVSVTVKDLLSRPFSTRSYEEMCDFVESAPPRPLLNITQECNKHTRKFHMGMYEKASWLSGCDTENKLYCWPCILFRKDKTTWNHKGFDNLWNFVKAVERHEKSREHLQCILKLSTFNKSTSDPDEKRMRLRQHNNRVERNRSILCRFIDVVCFLINQGLPFRGHSEDGTSLDRSNYVELAEFISSYDPVLKGHLDNDSTFSGLSESIQSDLTDAIHSVVIENVKAELKNAVFVSIQANEVTDISCKAQLSLAVRYVKDGRAVERFVGLYDRSSDRSANSTADLILHAVEALTTLDKLVAHTFDGAAVMVSELNDLQAMIKARAPNAHFVHGYAHALNFILSQSVTKIKECSIFFSTISGLATFFNEFSKRSDALERIVDCKSPAAPTDWKSDSNLVSVINFRKYELLSLFETMISEPQSWDSQTVLQAVDFLHTLRDFEFHWLLGVFFDIFSHIELLSETLQAKAYDITYCAERINETQTILVSKRDEHERFWNQAFTTMIEINGPMSEDLKYSSNKEKFAVLLCLIIDTIVNHLNSRFHSLSNLKFATLLDPSRFEEYARKFPDSSLNEVQLIFPSSFDLARLKNELLVVYGSTQFLGKHVHELALFLFDMDLLTPFFETYKLCSLLLTVPSMNASVEESFSTLKRLKCFQRAAISEDRFDNLSLLSIEKSYLSELRQKKTFYDDVVSVFSEKHRHEDFMYISK